MMISNDRNTVYYSINLNKVLTSLVVLSGFLTTTILLNYINLITTL